MTVDIFVFKHLPVMHKNHIHMYIYNRKVNEDTRIYVATNHCPVQWKNLNTKLHHITKRYCYHNTSCQETTQLHKGCIESVKKSV
jgi:hypothetical protein